MDYCSSEMTTFFSPESTFRCSSVTSQVVLTACTERKEWFHIWGNDLGRGDGQGWLHLFQHGAAQGSLGTCGFARIVSFAHRLFFFRNKRWLHICFVTQVKDSSLWKMTYTELHKDCSSRAPLLQQNTVCVYILYIWGFDVNARHLGGKAARFLWDSSRH